MLWKNTSAEQTVRLTLGGVVYSCAPGGTVDLPDLYCRSRYGVRKSDRLPPVIRDLAPQLEPCGPLPVEPKPAAADPVDVIMAERGVSRGVAEIQAQHDAAKAEARSTAKKASG